MLLIRVDTYLYDIHISLRNKNKKMKKRSIIRNLRDDDESLRITKLINFYKFLNFID